MQDWSKFPQWASFLFQSSITTSLHIPYCPLIYLICIVKGSNSEQDTFLLAKRDLFFQKFIPLSTIVSFQVFVTMAFKCHHIHYKHHKLTLRALKILSLLSFSITGRRDFTFSRSSCFLLRAGSGPNEHSSTRIESKANRKALVWNSCLHSLSRKGQHVMLME